MSRAARTAITVARSTETPALPVPVLGGDAEGFSQVVEGRVEFGHGAILAVINQQRWLQVTPVCGKLPRQRTVHPPGTKRYMISQATWSGNEQNQADP